jgi:TrmH family RNA methyltransferase
MDTPGALGARHADVERLRRLLRRRADRVAEGAFVLEGPKLLAEALAAGAPVEAVYIAEDAPPLELAVDPDRVRVLRADVLERVADTVTPQPVLAVCRTIDVPLSVVAETTFVVVCIDVQDPGNAGTILRSAEAAGAGAVVFGGSSVDPFNPKAVRASAGALFHVPVVVHPDPLPLLRQRRLGSIAGKGTPVEAVDLTAPVAVVLGNEAHGLPASAAIDEWVTIPMVGRSESLNVGMAAAVLCFEVARQRRA